MIGCPGFVGGVNIHELLFSKTFGLLLMMTESAHAQIHMRELVGVLLGEKPKYLPSQCEEHSASHKETLRLKLSHAASAHELTKVGSDQRPKVF